MNQPASFPKDETLTKKNCEFLPESGTILSKSNLQNQTILQTHNALGVDGEPMLPFYFCFYCCAKRILIKPLNKYYDIICNYIYTTDGTLFIGKYTNDIVDRDSEIPDIRYCCPCFTIQIIFC